VGQQKGARGRRNQSVTKRVARGRGKQSKLESPWPFTKAPAPTRDEGEQEQRKRNKITDSREKETAGMGGLQRPSRQKKKEIRVHSRKSVGSRGQ